MKWINKLFNKKETCCLCLHKIPIGEEYAEISLLSKTLGTFNYFHQYCWERYNDKVKWKQKTGTRQEAWDLINDRI